MEYFERVKIALLKFKTLIYLVIGLVFVLAVLSIMNRPNTQPKMYSNSTKEDLVNDEVFPSEIKTISIEDIDYTHFNEMGFTSLFEDDSNQVWLSEHQINEQFGLVSFDGVYLGKSDNGNTDYALTFYKNDLDVDATYEVYIYTSKSLENIEYRLGSDQCIWISNNVIQSSGDGFVVELKSNEEYIPYIFVECIEYKDGNENIYCRELVTDQDGYVSVYR